ncbi:tRNA epoxyqueuosine(34) reductase QueG [Allorhodopirellula solitaria]|uniref:Epoxyqueuosine reductase n=1 Tax=Allorhodopirellula solitaria TaxID=2527987 RepID=A0A5C5X1W7_9BACT|nr:tRNA epoxyqueuosine(34) reductase QueG [Allorhodopirellula solitaria]TWT56232.1 Epoxyqueuosine reductase [Allorhodopirellula solitaria]
MPLSKPAPDAIAAAIRADALAEGFIACGFAPALDSAGFSDLVEWIEAGFAAEMTYFADRLDAYRHPSGVLPGARSVVVLAYPYPATDPIPPDLTGSKIADGNGTGITIHGRVARYTWSGADYHDVIHPKLKRICRSIKQLSPEAHARGIVDTAPMMEREVAQLAGLGWRGKNTLLLSRTLGSYFFLACVLVDIELPSDTPFETDHCGTCTACLDACPTDAFVAPHVLDASKCISFLTIESRELIPESLRHDIGDWVFGCDVCQEVCPWNRKPSRRAIAAEGSDASGHQSAAQPSRGRMQLAELFWLDEDSFRERFRKTPMWRTRRRGLLRNAAIVLGNTGTFDCLSPLLSGLQDTEPMVRAACVWAIFQIGERSPLPLPDHVANALDQLRRVESQAMVLAELEPRQG